MYMQPRSPCLVLQEDRVVEFVQGRELLLVNQVELRSMNNATRQTEARCAYLIDEQEKVPVAGIEVRCSDALASECIESKRLPSIPSAQMWSKWLLYMCAYTRNKRRTIVRTVSLKFLGNGTPANTVLVREFPGRIWLGKMTDFIREHGLVVQEPLSPIHERIDVVRSGEFGGALVFDTVLPQVLVAGRVRCQRARRRQGIPTVGLQTLAGTTPRG
jgi:hypothetical protein